MSLLYFPLELLAYAGALMGAVLFSPVAVVLNAFDTLCKGAGEFV